MRVKNVLFLFIFFAFVFTFPAALIAQQELTETYTSADGKFTISYPASWDVTDSEDGPIAFNGDGALFQVSFYDSANSGYAPVTALELLEIGVGEDPETRAALEFNEPEELIIAGFPALQSGSSFMGQLNTVIDFGGGMFGTLIGFGDVAALKPTVMAMMESIQYGDGPAPIVESPLDDVQPITSVNAAGVTQLMTLGDETVSIESLSFNPDSNLLAAAASDGSVHLWDIATGESRLVLEGHTDGATSVAFGGGGYLLAVGTGSGQVRLWDATTGEGSGIMQEHDTPVESVAFLTDGFLVASGALDGSVRLWDVASRAEQAVLVDNDNLTPVESVAFSPDGATLAAGGGNTIRIWDIATKTVQAVLETEIGDISSVSFRPDGALLVYGGSDPAAWVWDFQNDNRVLLEGHANQVFTLAFSPDGQVIASGDSGTVRFWDAATGENLAALESPDGQDVNSVAFSPDGTILASSGQSGGVVLWGTKGGGETSQETTEPETTEETTASTSGCTITAPSNANLRSGPGTEFDRAGALSAGQTVEADGQAQGADGMVWYRLTDGTWVRSDVVGTPSECANIPVVTA